MSQVADDQLPDRELDGARTAMWDMITGYRLSQIARVAAALSLAEHCAGGPVTAEQIAQLESADPAATGRLLRAGAAVGLLTCRDDLYFSATPLLNTLHKDTPGSLRGFALSLPARGHWLPCGNCWRRSGPESTRPRPRLALNSSITTPLHHRKRRPSPPGLTG